MWRAIVLGMVVVCSAHAARACDVVVNDCSSATAVVSSLVVLPQAVAVPSVAVELFAAQNVRVVPLVVQTPVVIEQRVVRQRVRVLGRRRAVRRLAAGY
jgi:hypothetical protein